MVWWAITRPLSCEMRVIDIRGRELTLRGELVRTEHSVFAEQRGLIAQILNGVKDESIQHMHA
jgi:hypothetical protein